MVVTERFKMSEISRPCPVIESEHQTGPRWVTTDAARRLDVLSSVLWLARDDHEAKPANVDTNLQHARCQQDVDRPRTVTLWPWAHLASCRRVHGWVGCQLQLTQRFSDSAR